MTEAEWVECQDPHAMLRLLRAGDRLTNRRARLFAVGCCLPFEGELYDRRSRNALEVAAAHAERAATNDSLAGARHAAEAAFEEYDVPYPDGAAYHAVALAVGEDAALSAANVIAAVVAAAANEADLKHWVGNRRVRGRLWTDFLTNPFCPLAVAGPQSQPALALARALSSIGEAEGKRQASLLRDIFGNPFRPVTLDPAWLRWNDAAIPRIAQAIYDYRQFADLPILADALEEAGCTSGDILAHCRQGGEHVRGCWVLDLVLGKA